jgi:hypothetical protein
MEEQTLSNELLKRGEWGGQTKFVRTKSKLYFEAQFAPAIEELIKSWSKGSVDVFEYGRDWVQANEPLLIYQTLQTTGIVQVNAGLAYTIDKPGQPLLQKLPGGGELVNISFLRIVGISDATTAGKRFEIKGMHSLDFLRDLLTKINRCVSHFYLQYLIPVDMTIVLQSQETRL